MTCYCGCAIHSIDTFLRAGVVWGVLRWLEWAELSFSVRLAGRPSLLTAVWGLHRYQRASEEKYSDSSIHATE